MSEIDDAFFKAGTSFDRPMPGQSLTDDPATPRPFEQPPTYTKKEEVLEYYFEVLTQENTYQTILEALLSDVPIMDVVKSLLFRDFQEGMFNPDMMLLVAEPLAYMIAALAERADVDFTIMGGPSTPFRDSFSISRFPCSIEGYSSGSPIIVKSTSALSANAAII